VRLCWLLVLSSLLGFSQGPGRAILAGAVYDSSGNPIAGASIKLIQGGTGTVTHVLSDQNGRYTISGLAPGAYRVSV
jgi:protocatechuate 3,4-dioxygenase beta subunit